MNTEILRKYRAERAKGTPASYAYRYAKGTSTDPVYPFLAKLDTDSPAKGSIGPYTVTVIVVADEDARLGDDDVTGTFTDTYEPGCIRNTRRDWGTDFDWYRPSTYTRTEAYKDLRAAGMSKGVARDALAERVRAEMIEDAGRRYHGVHVTVQVTGQVPGRALSTASLWSIDTVPGYESAPYFIEVATELISDALREARDELPAAIERNAAEAAALAAALAWRPADQG